jgi:NADH-quinone oxidoreductase subunit N
VIATPSIEYVLVMPMLIVFGAAVTGVFIEAFQSRSRRRVTQLAVCIGALGAALVAVIALAGTRRTALMGAIAVDGPALFLQGLTLLVGLLAMLLIAARGGDAFVSAASAVPGSAAEVEAMRAGVPQTAVYPLAMFAVGGMMLLPAANDLLTMFIALEALSLPLYVMCGLARRRRLLSQEAALKYFLLGAFSSAFFLYGVALLYGCSGTFSLAGVGAAVAGHARDTNPALIAGGLVAMGLLFKVGAVPFHVWVPDVYQGAPTPIVAFMAAATKIAAFGAMLRIFSVALPDLREDWRPVLSVIAALTMVLGAVMAVTQSNVKRMLAYSAVTQAGFLLLGVVAAGEAGVTSTLFYLVAYSFGTVGAFAVVGLLRDSAGMEDTHIDRWAGLAQRSPALAVAFALFLLAFAGIPLTSGFVSKFAVFAAAASAGAMPMVVVAVIASVVAAFVYARLILLMFFVVPPAQAGPVAGPGPFAGVAILTAAVVTLVAGILPQPLLTLAGSAGAFVG